jgi:hypothetical protein
MAWYDGILSNTVGVVFSAATGKPDPWQLQQIKDDTAAQIQQALGPDADPAAVAAAQAQSGNEIDNFLLQTNQHPSQAALTIPGLGDIGSPDFLAKLEKIVYGVIGIAAIGGVVYFGFKFRSAFKK